MKTAPALTKTVSFIWILSYTFAQASQKRVLYLILITIIIWLKLIFKSCKIVFQLWILNIMQDIFIYVISTLTPTENAIDQSQPFHAMLFYSRLHWSIINQFYKYIMLCNLCWFKVLANLRMSSNSFQLNNFSCYDAIYQEFSHFFRDLTHNTQKTLINSKQPVLKIKLQKCLWKQGARRGDLEGGLFKFKK